MCGAQIFYAMKYIYGPVNSRRLGLSLGVSLTPHKTCNLDCLYCQLGRHGKTVSLRGEYVNIEDVFEELKCWLRENTIEARELKFITISGSGEPTLNTGIAELITRIKGVCACPVAVITNASFLHEPSVRRALCAADLIVPSLDAVSQEVFAKINRPHEGIRIDQIIEGLVALRSEFNGRIWLEVMLVEGVNDDLPHIRKLKKIAERINPDKIQLNSPVRTTAEPGVLPVKKNKLLKIKEILGKNCEIA